MEKVELKVQRREETGKGIAGRLRKDGYVPAVLYGPAVETIPLSIKSTDLLKVLGTKNRDNVLINLTVKGGTQKESVMTVLPKEIQKDPVKRNIVHIDLYKIMMDREIRVSVPIRITGNAKGVVEKGGVLQHDIRELDIECLPARLPDGIDVDVTDMDIGDSVHVRDVRAEEGISILSNGNLTVVSIVAPVKEVEIQTAEEMQDEISGSFEETEEKEVEKE
ncbi:MAG: 50S ribosomal protein L25 [Thermodesulfobacteriota bacterium]